MNTLLEEYDIDFIGSSASLEDRAIYDTCGAFFKQKTKYILVLLNIGAQHGFYLNTKDKDEDRMRFTDACCQFFEYIQKKCPTLCLLTATPNSKKGEETILDENKNKEISSRNEVQKNSRRYENGHN